MAMQSIAEKATQGEREIKYCPDCGRSSEEVTLLMPRYLTHDAAKAYDGPMYCLSDAPRFRDGATLDLVAKLTNTPAYKPFGGDAA
jgi:hypothetical protein